MSTRERAKDRGRRLGLKCLSKIGDELRLARIKTGTSRAELGQKAGVSRTTEARYESGSYQAATIVGAAELLAVAGLGLAITTYPLGDPPRDIQHGALGLTLIAHIAQPLGWRTEVPLPNPGDARGWDVLITGNRKRTGVEIVRFMGDVQDLGRRIALKRRDGGVDYLLVVIEDTPTNRRIVREWPTFLPELPRLSTNEVLEALEAGRHPEDGIVLLHMDPGVHTTRA